MISAIDSGRAISDSCPPGIMIAPAVRTQASNSPVGHGMRLGLQGVRRPAVAARR